MRCISTTTHGAALAIVGADGLVLPVLDYEYAGPDAVAEAYRPQRGAFWETLSPDLPAGLNAGTAGLLARGDLSLRLRPRAGDPDVSAILGMAAHRKFSSPSRPRSAAIPISGTRRAAPSRASPRIAAGRSRSRRSCRPGRRPAPSALRWPARPGCRKTAASSPASMTAMPACCRTILRRKAPFAVLSSGTWLITFAIGGSMADLDPARDCLANVDAFGRPVPSARFMGGREFERLAEGAKAEPTEADIAAVVAKGAMALPSFAPGTGPYAFLDGHWTIDPSGLSAGERIAAASLYCALVASTCWR